jgi:hypothetical protein
MDPLGSAGLGSVSAMARGDVFGRSRDTEGTAGYVRATAVLLPKQLHCCARVGTPHGMATILPGLPARRIAVPVVRLSPPVALRDAASGGSERLVPTRQQSGAR